MKKLKKLDGAVDKLFEWIEPLENRTGVILWQLPPMLRKDPERLNGFLSLLPKQYKYAVEFRHRSWLAEDIFKLLRRYRVGHVSLSSQGMPMNLTVTSNVVYIRFHGLEGGAAHDYTRRELEPWAKHVRQQARKGKQVFAYFNNDTNVRVPANAKMLMAMVG